MTRIKICGITNLGDALAAVEAGADALGFIGVPESPRFVTPEAVRAILHHVPPFVSTVAVVKEPLDAVGYPCQLVQFYTGDQQAAALRAIRVFRIKDRSSLILLRDHMHPAEAFLLDTYHETALGGVGKTFDWTLAREAKAVIQGKPLILAGGLTSENVADAVRQVRPYAVDVSSGVEAEPGRKDHDKVRRFIAAVRSASTEA